MEEEKKGTLDRVELFYLPIFEYKNVIDDNQGDALLEFCMQQDYVSTVEGNSAYTSTSADHNVMSKIPEMGNFFEKLVSDISYQIMRQKSTSFVIPNSWCTKTEKGQMSIPHLHKNYYMSGVLYLQDDCSIEIQNPLFKLNPFIIDVQELTPFTSSSSLFYPQKNSFVMFPAWLEHGIPRWEKDEDRYSIAMNIHPVGQYGLATSSMYIDPNTVK
jgi:uncharacterized protein (TIGR02466 family)|tara:strand:- start:38 stop:682 length:645 start_codon:yes stop_codon:yes gene_type:complete